MQGLDRSLLSRRVERLLAPWIRPVGPGVMIGVVLGRELVVHESAGMASIEHAVPIGPSTAFRIASVSKQFTCAAILLLARDGRLSIDDDVRRHILGLPDLGHRVTLSHLMHNTSGIRDMLEIMRLGGADLAHPCTPQDLLDGVCRQRGLNFEPGSRYLYSNSNFMLLGRVVEQVSGLSLRDFLDRRIFTPLGMNATRHVERTTEVVPDLATGYMPAPGGGWMRAQHGFPLHGEGGLVSSVVDLALWHANVASPRMGGPALANALTAMTPFGNGHPNTYACGLRLRTYRGVRTIGHDGLWPGYRSSFVRIPDDSAAVICLSNDATADPQDLAFRVVDALIEGRPGVHAAPPMPETAKLPGRYLNRENGATVDVAVDKAGCLTASTYGVTFDTVATADGYLATSRGSDDFAMRLLADDVLEVRRDAGMREILHRIADGAGLPPDLPGHYSNADTAAAWTIAATDAGMTLRISGPLCVGGPWEIEPIEGDFIRVISPMTLFRAWLDARVMRDTAGAVTGLRVDGGRARNLFFAREH
jgi:CubicO group peptidase (beta-lactamase class C family)